MLYFLLDILLVTVVSIVIIMKNTKTKILIGGVVVNYAMLHQHLNNGNIKKVVLFGMMISVLIGNLKRLKI